MVEKTKKTIRKTSLVYWYHFIKDLPIPQPKTVILRIPEKILPILYEEKLPNEMIKIIKALLIKEDLKYPIFARTDLSSGKHGWKDTCYIESEDKLWNNILEIISHNLCADIFGLDFRAFVFREFLQLDYKFKAFYGDLPIAKERRYFVKDGKVQCRHPYWPEWSIELRKVSETNWKKLLKELNQETKKEIEILSKYTEMVGKVLDGYWSIDFAQDINGTWHLIDMAIGDESFHWLDCEYCPEKQKEQYGKIIERNNRELELKKQEKKSAFDVLI